MTADDLTATLTQALTDEPYLLADVLCSHAHPEQRMTMTGFTTGRGFVVSCALCKASSSEMAGDFAKGLAPTVVALIEAAEKRGAQRALTEAADALDTIRHDHTAMLDALVRAGVLATMWAAVNEAGGCIVRATRREAENDLARMCNQTLRIDEPPPPAPVGIRRRYVTEWTADA